MKLDPETLTVAVLRRDGATLARLVREARGVPMSVARLHRIQRALDPLARWRPYSYDFLSVLMLGSFASVFRIVAAGVPALLLWGPFGLSRIACALDSLIAVLERRPWIALWMGLWVVLLLVLTSACVWVAAGGWAA